MPHVVAEYSANLEQSTDIGKLLDVIHGALFATGEFPLEVLRIRAARRDQYKIANDDPKNAFLAIVGHIAPGRPASRRRDIGQAVFDAVCAHLDQVSKMIPLSITLELHEIEQTAAFRKNTIKAPN
jgi:5-carboxymethyl-2-hydroxymuconate isomerase